MITGSKLYFMSLKFGNNCHNLASLYCWPNKSLLTLCVSTAGRSRRTLSSRSPLREMMRRTSISDWGQRGLQKASDGKPRQKGHSLVVKLAASCLVYVIWWQLVLIWLTIVPSPQALTLFLHSGWRGRIIFRPNRVYSLLISSESTALT